jgi:hypothetical protein
MKPNEIADKVIKRIENAEKPIVDLVNGWIVDSEVSIHVRSGVMKITLNYTQIACFSNSGSVAVEAFKEERIAYDRIWDAISKRKALDKQNALDKL